MEEKKLKLYVNKNLMIPAVSYTPLLFPFFDPILKDSTPYKKAIFKKYNFDRSYYTLVEAIEEADFVLIPHSYWYLKANYPELLERFIKEAEDYHKLVLIDAYGDFSDEINIKNSVVIRTSQYRSQKKENEIIVPAYAEDLLSAYFNDNLFLRQKSSLPIVGFAGWADLSFYLRVKTFLKDFLKPAVRKKGIYFRRKAVNTLLQSTLVKSNLIIRNFYSGHINTVRGDMNKLRREFINNMLNSDYVLCVKGDGNYSIRFYEALSMGRIPLFIDTECVLPLDDIIDYKEFCVFVNWSDINKIDKILSDFHKSLSEARFLEMQKKARYTFENYLRIDKFTQYLIEKLKKIRAQ